MDIIQLVLGFIAQYPVVGVILFVMGAFRVVFKPFFAVLQSYVNYTPNPADNTVLASIMESPIYLGVVKLLDFLASIKLPVK